MTGALIKEALGTKTNFFYQIDSNIYLVSGLQKKWFPVATRKEGGMDTRLTSRHHMYVWKRYTVQGRSASIFQFVGVLESMTENATFRRGLTSYVSERKFRPLGADSVYDDSPLSLKTRTKPRERSALRAST